MLMRIAAVAFSLLFLVAGTTPAQGSSGSVTATFLAGDYTIEETGAGHEVVMEGFGRLPTTGMPNLPAKIFHVAVPPGAEVTDVIFSMGEAVELEGEYDIAPVSLHRVVTGEDPALYEQDLAAWEANHHAVYHGSASYPQRQGEFVQMAGYRKYNLAALRIAPMTWHPQTRKLCLHPRITARVEYTLPGRMPSGVVLVDNQIRTERVAREIVHNYDQAQAWYPGGAPVRGLHDYVIITLDSLTTSVQPLVDWETTKGRNVYVATTTWINSNYTGYDLAEKMRNFLRDKYPSTQWGIEDVCLVGHYDDVPMRRCWQDLGYGKPETDYYFAELSKPDDQSWDKDQDHKWGESTDPIDWLTEVNVGRIPWSGAATVQHICEKSAAYEFNQDPAFKKNILLLGAFFWPNTDNAKLMEYKSNTSNCPWMADWTKTKLYEVGHSGYPCDMNLTWANTNSEWSNGKYAFVNWAGHGSETGCYIYYSSGPFVSTSTCNNLNDDYPAIIFADACSNSDTDYTNLGASMLKKGGVGFVGATKVALGSPGWSNPSHGSSQSMDFYFTSNVTSGDYTQGAGHQKALRTMYTNGLWGSTRYEMFEWGALWGNPDLGLDPVVALHVFFPEGLPQGHRFPGLKTKLTVEIKDGLEQIVPGSEKVHYRYDPAASYTVMTLTSLGNDLFEALLPATQPGDQPEYYFSVQGNGGTTVYSPANAPGNAYSFDVYMEQTLLEDDFEADIGWTVEDVSLQDGAWERAVPGFTFFQPGADHSPGGTQCFVTGKEAGMPDDDDVDGGPTRLISPTIDLSCGDGTIDFYLWYYQAGTGTTQPLSIHLSNNNGATWTKAADIDLVYENNWKYYAYAVSDHITPTDKVKIRFSVLDNPDDDIVEALVDDLKVTGRIYDPTLWADAYSIPVSMGGAVDFNIDAGAGNAGRNYLLLGTLSGTYPGFTLPGGKVLPLNWDVFTDLIMVLVNTPSCQGFMGKLDGSGQAAAGLDTFGPLDPVLIGSKAYFAYALNNPFDFVSNSMPVTFDP
jgi:hypothetical protein